MNRETVLSFTAGALICLVSPASRAAFVVVDDFDGLTAGAVNGQNGWVDTAGDGSVTADPDNAGNQVLSVLGPATGNANIYKSLGAGIANNTTGTVFFRMRNGNPGDFVAGASDVAAPTAWGDYEGYQAFKNGDIFVRNGGGFADVGDYTGDEWYNIWLVLSNSTDATVVYASQGGAPAVMLGAGSFRNGTTDALATFLVRSGTIQAGVTGYIDDIYIDTTGANLANPVPEPASLALLGLGGLMLARRRR